MSYNYFTNKLDLNKQTNGYIFLEGLVSLLFSNMALLVARQ